MKYSKRLAMWVILASSTLSVMAGSIIAPGLNQMREGLAIDPAAAGRIITTHGLFIALFSPLMGGMIDRIGTKRPYVLGLMVFGLAGGAGLIVDSYWLLIASRAILGIGAAAFFTAITVTIFGLYSGEDRNRVMGWRGSANSIGGIIWPLIGGALGRISWHLPFGVYLLGVLLGFLGMATVPETERNQGQDTETHTVEDKGSILTVFRSNPILLLIYGLLFLSSLLLYVIVAFLPQLLGRLGISDSLRISWFIAAMTTAAGLTSFLYGRIRARLSYLSIAAIALALWASGFTFIFLPLSILTIPVGVVLYGVGQGMLTPAMMIWAGETVSASFRGRVLAYLGTFSFIGQFLSPIVFGALLPSVGLDGVFLVGAGLCALILVSLLIGVRAAR
ncbi:MAG: MFS transporter [Anaerolineae bacterium]|jgi:MFS family permease